MGREGEEEGRLGVSDAGQTSRSELGALTPYSVHIEERRRRKKANGGIVSNAQNVSYRPIDKQRQTCEPFIHDGLLLLFVRSSVPRAKYTAE